MCVLCERMKDFGPSDSARCAFSGVNGDAGLAVLPPCRLTSPGSRSFKPRDAGANPVKAANFRQRVSTRARCAQSIGSVSALQWADDKHEVGSAACRPISARMVQEQHAASPGLRSGCNSPCAHHFPGRRFP